MNNMKKICALLVLWLFIPLSIQANTVFFAWFNTDLIIPLGDSLEPFLNVPYAKLNAPNDDPNLYYEKNGVNYTYQSVIQTSVVKTYRLDFRVYSPKYRISSTQTITIQVVDLIPPIFHKVPVLEVTVFTKTVDYTQGLQYSDNYTATHKLILKIDSNAVNLNQIGAYPVLYTLCDEFGNETKTMTYIIVKDYFAPMITQIKPILLNPGQNFEVDDFFLIKDNYDVFVHVWVHDETVDYDTIGIYPIGIEAYDQSGNHHRVDTTLEIRDVTPPELYLTSKELYLNIHESLDLKTLILKVKDNHSALSIDDVVITTDLDIHKVGFYEALFEIQDLSGLKTSHSVTIYVVNKHKPTVTFDPMTIEKGYPYDLMSGIHNETEDAIKIHVYDTNLEMKKGTYDVVYVIIDAYGNHATAIRQVTVHEETSEVSITIYIIFGIAILATISLGSLWIWKKRRL
jgi:hypothetical protein